MEEIDIPSFFLCPISMEIMRDPVIISTGITYDRENIERWLFSGKNKSCPVTKLCLSEFELTPNETLRRCIQSWCIANASNGIEPIPTPKCSIEKTHIIKILEELNIPEFRLRSLYKLKSIASESDRNKWMIVNAGGARILASIVKTFESSVEEEVVDQALAILYRLEITAEVFKEINEQKYDFFDSIIRILQFGSDQSRLYAIYLVKAMLDFVDPIYAISIGGENLKEILNILKHRISNKTSTCALQILLQLCYWEKNTRKIVLNDGVSILIQLLLETSEKRICEMALTLLDLLCHTAEGRSALLNHGAGLAIVSKKILRVSLVASERAVKILLSISKFSATPQVLQEMLQVGVVSKMCLSLQVDCGINMKEDVAEILRLHSKTWRRSSCVPLHLLAFYPSARSPRN